MFKWCAINTLLLSGLAVDYSGSHGDQEWLQPLVGKWQTKTPKDFKFCFFLRFLEENFFYHEHSAYCVVPPPMILWHWCGAITALNYMIAATGNVINAYLFMHCLSPKAWLCTLCCMYVCNAPTATIQQNPIKVPHGNRGNITKARMVQAALPFPILLFLISKSMQI